MYICPQRAERCSNGGGESEQRRGTPQAGIPEEDQDIWHQGPHRFPRLHLTRQCRGPGRCNRCRHGLHSCRQGAGGSARSTTHVQTPRMLQMFGLEACIL